MSRTLADRILAAQEIRGLPGLSSWDDADWALTRLGECFPDNPNRAHVLVKAAAIDKLYSTREGNIYWVANAVVDTFTKLRDGELEVESGVDVVNSISREKKRRHPKARRCSSFASKYCHFFVRDWDFPIYDSFALAAARNVLGRVSRGQITEGALEYRDFCDRLALLRTRDAVTATTREMDRFLWLWGQWLAQSGHTGAVVNDDVFRVFRSTDPGVVQLVEALQP